MPEGRAERAVEAPAKSIDGAEHSGMIKRVPEHVTQREQRHRPEKARVY